MAYRSVFAAGFFAGQVIVVTGGGSGVGRCTTGPEVQQRDAVRPYDGFHRRQVPRLFRA